MDIKVDGSVGLDTDGGVIASWYFKDGDAVRQGDIVAEIMVEKAQLEVIAPTSGILRIRKGQEETVGVGDVIAVIE